MNNLINDGGSYVLQITSVYLYTEYKILCRFTVTTALHYNINVRLEVSHKQKLYKVIVINTYYTFCTSRLVLHLRSLDVNHAVYLDYGFMASL